MNNDDQTLSFLRRASAPLPSESDFVPHTGDPDAQYAWKHFGQLTLNQAYDLFLSHPELYQEDFIFMGSNAFYYYFPVIDCYIRQVTGDEEGDDREVAILGHALAFQLDCTKTVRNNAFVREIAQLTDYVILNLTQYSPAAKDQRRIEREWSHVRQKVVAGESKSWPPK